MITVREYVMWRQGVDLVVARPLPRWETAAEVDRIMRQVPGFDRREVGMWLTNTGRGLAN